MKTISYKEMIRAVKQLSPSQKQQFIKVFDEDPSEDYLERLERSYNLVAVAPKDGSDSQMVRASEYVFVEKKSSSTPAKPSERRHGSLKNKPNSASGSGKVTFSESVTQGLKNKVKEHNESSSKKVTLGQLKAVYRRGAGAFSTSHRPNMTRGQWAMARVNSFLKRVKGSGGHKEDDDLIKKSEFHSYDLENYVSFLTKSAKYTRDKHGNIVYRGEKFAGFNKPMRDSGKKQGKVLVKEGDRIKVVRFGDPKLPDNTSVEQNDRFYDRFGHQKGMNDKFSPLYWSARWLWPRGSMKGKGTKPFYKLKGGSVSKATNEFIIKAVNEEQQIALELIYEPNKVDAHGQWMSEETLQKGCDNFEENRKKGIAGANLFHLKATDKVEIIRTFIMPIKAEINGYTIEKGTWLGEFKYHDSELWKARKEGRLAGVSMGGRGRVHKPQNKDE